MEKVNKYIEILTKSTINNSIEFINECEKIESQLINDFNQVNNLFNFNQLNFSNRNFIKLNQKFQTYYKTKSTYNSNNLNDLRIALINEIEISESKLNFYKAFLQKSLLNNKNLNRIIDSEINEIESVVEECSKIESKLQKINYEDFKKLGTAFFSITDKISNQLNKESKNLSDLNYSLTTVKQKRLLISPLKLNLITKIDESLIKTFHKVIDHINRQFFIQNISLENSDLYGVLLKKNNKSPLIYKNILSDIKGETSERISSLLDKYGVISKENAFKCVLNLKESGISHLEASYIKVKLTDALIKEDSSLCNLLESNSIHFNSTICSKEDLEKLYLFCYLSSINKRVFEVLNTNLFN